MVWLERRGDGRGALRRSPVPRVRGTGWDESLARPGQHPEIATLAGAAPAGRAIPANCECTVGRERLLAQGRYGRRCHADCRAKLDEEPGRQARPGNAPDEEGQ